MRPFPSIFRPCAACIFWMRCVHPNAPQRGRIGSGKRTRLPFPRINQPGARHQLLANVGGAKT
eukprot:6247322-Prymnesium_polylepis.1